MHSGPLYEMNMKNMKKNGAFSLPKIFEKLRNLTEILFFSRNMAPFRKKGDNIFCFMPILTLFLSFFGPKRLET